MSSTTNYLDIIRKLIADIPADANKCNRRALLTSKMYRGRQQICAGYSWSRVGSNPITGMVYDTIIGFGNTPEEAIQMMKNKIATTSPTSAVD